jgi:hypothetical protein
VCRKKVCEIERCENKNMEECKMFFITAIERTTSLKEIGNSRCFGYYPTKEEAIEAVKANAGNLQDHEYHYLVIEEIPKGIHPCAKEVAWFKWNGGWNEINKPVQTEEISNHAFG